MSTNIKELFTSKLLAPSTRLKLVMMTDKHESDAKQVQEDIISSSVHECAALVHLNPEIIQRSQHIERGLKYEGRKIQGSLELQEGVIKPLLREILDKYELSLMN